MIVCLDSHALVERRVCEAGSDEVQWLLARVPVVGTGVATRAEVAAVLARASRMGLVARDQAEVALPVFRSERPRLARIQPTEPLLARADALAWVLGQ
jgi:predicted nucleic acid-binding protein